ncbi:MAG: Two component regulator three Y domain protein [Flavobacteriaceae bacterium]
MKKILLTSLLLSGMSLWAQIPDTEHLALVALYETTNGALWNTTWDLEQSPDAWDGVTITNGHVTEIRMLFNNLDGSLPAQLSQLTELKVLELSFNKLHGNLPSSFGNLKKLEILALNGNDLTGEIPASFGQLANLKQLHLSSNHFSGMLPNSLNQLENLVVFNVFQNELSGDLPLTLARSRNLKEFVVAENHFNTTSEISTILLSNSAYMDFNNGLTPTGKSIIAIEVEEGN